MQWWVWLLIAWVVIAAIAGFVLALALANAEVQDAARRLVEDQRFGPADVGPIEARHTDEMHGDPAAHREAGAPVEGSARGVPYVPRQPKREGSHRWTRRRTARRR